MHKLTIELPVPLFEELKLRKGNKTIKDYIINLLEREFEAHTVKTLILCGGEGAKLKPITSAVPKPLIPVGYKPLIEYQFDNLVKYGYDDVLLLIGHLGSRVIQYWAMNKRTDLTVTTISEFEPLDTAGAIGNARAHIRKRFLVLNGDVLTNINLRALEAHHIHNKKMVTMAVVPLPAQAAKSKKNYGVVELNFDGTLRSYEETAGPHRPGTLVNAGVYMMEPEVFEHIPVNTAMSLDRDLFPKLVDDGQVNIFQAPDQTYWHEVSQVESYAAAWQDFFEGKILI